jgi:hypothetical protein
MIHSLFNMLIIIFSLFFFLFLFAHAIEAIAQLTEAIKKNPTKAVFFAMRYTIRCFYFLFFLSYV